MAIIPAPGGSGQVVNNLLRLLSMEKETEIAERRAEIAERQQKLREQQAEAEAAAGRERLDLLNQTVQGAALLQQMFPQAQQPAAAFTPNLQPGQAQPVPTEFDPSQVEGDVAAELAPALEEEVERRRKTSSIDEALGIIRKEAARIGDPSIARRAEAALQLNQAGVDASVITQTLPPSAQELTDLQIAKLNLQEMETEQDADAFATGWLQQRGVVPEGAPPIPGSHETLLSVAEARSGETINWVQEGLDFVTSRVGDPVSGSPFTVDPETGSLGLAAGGEGAVPVEDAISEWKAIVSSYAPEGQRDEILERIDSNLFQRRLRVRRATLFAQDIFRNSEDVEAATSDVKEILGDDFTESEVSEIIRKARQRANRPRR